MTYRSSWRDLALPLTLKLTTKRFNFLRLVFLIFKMVMLISDLSYIIVFVKIRRIYAVFRNQDLKLITIC